MKFPEGCLRKFRFVVWVSGLVEAGIVASERYFSTDSSKNWQAKLGYLFCFNVSNKHPLSYLSSSSDLLNSGCSL